ncbi:transferrin-binding protein-like solute binding protein [Aggregatibacter aphrophilus]|uniref:transferrin-binding protein-like solute binding protein n=1 Tax=Aggregatibacter aphrophilus TaxID=732 RepID=UPI000D6E4142|nr:transferrin-binding protein-like solute binding protein [Aggregatibacter aphrophilus]
MGNFKYSISKLSLIVLTSLTVAACGSGGNGGNPSPGQPQQPQPQQPQPQQPQPQQPQPQQPQPQQPQPPELNNPSDGRLSGNGYKVPKNNSLDTPFPIQPDGDINHLKVDNKSIEIIPTSKNIGEFISDQERIVGSSENTRWGFIYGDNGTENNYLFAIGKNATAVMPSGIAHYVGRAAHLSAKNSYHNTSGKVDINVNFDSKTLEGKITPDSGKANLGAEAEIKLSANIVGNTFEGEANGTQVNGGFYGSSASELIGTYKNVEEKYMGSFGAQKQN